MQFVISYYIPQHCQLHLWVRSLVVNEMFGKIPLSLGEGCCCVLDNSSGITETRNFPGSINTPWFTVLQEQGIMLTPKQHFYV
jgi:hypothetical protein